MAAPNDQSSAPTIIRGLVVPLAWAKSGQPISFGLAAFDETQYALGPESSQACFGELIRQVVEMEGRVETERDGLPLLEVTSHRVLNTAVAGSANGRKNGNNNFGEERER